MLYAVVAAAVVLLSLLLLLMQESRRKTKTAALSETGATYKSLAHFGFPWYEEEWHQMALLSIPVYS